MFSNFNEENRDPSGYGYGPPDEASREHEVPYVQDNTNHGIPVAAPVVVSDFAPVDRMDVPVNMADDMPGSTPIAAPGVNPVGRSAMPGAAPGGLRDNAPPAASGVSPADRFNIPVTLPVGTHGSAPGVASAAGSVDRFNIPPAPGGMQDNPPIGPPGAAKVSSPVGSPVVPPIERSDTQNPDRMSQQQRMFNFRGYYDSGTRPVAPQYDGWREPSYSQAHETLSNMYTPGIYANPPYSSKRAAPPQPELKRQQDRSGIAGRIIGAVCLVIICVTLSGLTAYGITAGWFGFEPSRNNAVENVPPVINQVVQGSANANSPRSDGLIPSVTTSGAGMPAMDIYDMACSQVVGIKTEVPDMMGGFFSTQGTTAVSGSGFIISSDGYILTNYHVIETAYQSNLTLTVSLHDGTEYEAKVIGYESNNDVALIKIEASDLNAVIIANSDNIRVGQPVYAVGNPFGDLVYTMTEGIVSALDRIATVDNKSIETFQFSAAVNYGNSGGPVYDLNGEVIGIVSAKIMGTSVEGIGFAIPINDAIDIASKLIEHGYISGRPLIGVTVNTVTSAHAEYYDWVVGAYIRSISPGSAAEKAGLMVGDIIISLGDSDIDSMDALLFTMRKYKAGDTVTITVWRSGTEIEKTITFDENLTAGQPQRSQNSQQAPVQPEQPEQNNGRIIPSPQFPETPYDPIYPEIQPRQAFPEPDSP